MKRLLLLAAICLGLLLPGPFSTAQAQDVSFLPENPLLAQRAKKKPRAKKRSRSSRRRAAAKRKREEAQKSRDIAFYSLGLGFYVAAPIALIGLSDDDLSAGRAVVHSSVLGPLGGALAVGGIATFFKDTSGPSTGYLGNSLEANLILGSLALAGGIALIGAGAGIAEDLKGEDLPGGLVAIDALGAISAGLGAGLISDSMDASFGATAVFAIGASVLGMSLVHALVRGDQVDDDGDSDESKPVIFATPLIIF